MRDAFDDFDLHQMVGKQAQGPAGVTGGRLRAGELGDPGFDFAGDLDLASGSFARLALKRAKRPDLAAAFPQAFKAAGGDSGGLTDVGILPSGTVGTFVGQKHRQRAHDLRALSALLVADRFKFMALVFGQFDSV